MLASAEILQNKLISLRPQSSLIERAEEIRIEAGQILEDKKRSLYGQFFTPSVISQIMSSMIGRTGLQKINLLDPGAGTGILTASCISHLFRYIEKPKEISVTAVEIDNSLISYLRETLNECRSECAKNGIDLTFNILNEDFITFAEQDINSLFSEFNQESQQKYDLVVLNPPYNKINTNSETNRTLRRQGIIAPNYYAAFLALSAEILEENGELIAITPRSFCNGTYFKPFRKFFLERMSFSRFHIFESRKENFDSDILQENIIFRAVKNKTNQTDIIVSTSNTKEETPENVIRLKAEQLVYPLDKELYIHLGGNESEEGISGEINYFQTSLEDLGLKVSTGRVVDFRVKGYLQNELSKDAVPLIYPHNMKEGRVQYPIDHAKKYNAICIASDTKSQLVKSGTYVLVKRFSTKEEKRRISASLFEAGDTSSSQIGFENHLNYFHARGEEIEPKLARGLVIYLNSSLLDSYFRRFSGHTQVNATDLRYLKYPTRKELEELGTYFKTELPAPTEIDNLIEKIISNEHS